jgi:DeoR/GlpR family transcriptional regulator of sugar metabolism
MAAGDADDQDFDTRRVPAGARHARILELIHRDGFVSVAHVAAEFAVSDMTIRRDLHALEERALLVRTHGGAIGAGHREVFDVEEPAFASRRRRNAAAKTAIAEAAARLIGIRETVGLDVGTTTLALAEAISPRGGITVVTNNLHAAAVLGRGRNRVHVPGGTVRGPELSVVGSSAVQQIGQYYFSKVFLGVSGLIGEGLFDYSPDDTDVKRAFIAQAEEVIVLCDSSKFGHRSLIQVCELGKVSALVTEAPPPRHIAEAIASANAEIVVAPPRGAPMPSAA